MRSATTRPRERQNDRKTREIQTTDRRRIAASYWAIMADQGSAFWATGLNRCAPETPETRTTGPNRREHDHSRVWTILFVSVCILSQWFWEIDKIGCCVVLGNSELYDTHKLYMFVLSKILTMYTDCSV